MLKKDRIVRKRRIRAKISGTAKTPRLSVFRSDRYIYAQIIDDTKGITLVSASDMKLEKGTKMEKAMAIGEEIAKKAKEKKIKKVIFDRNGFAYHGRIKAVAEGARKAGLEF
ncbi:50S ribosomal protein L18 [Candidatus Microgenomates bacterium]|nr:50S ribosomal protein L18 [Candidatus Microgenomates bacterium]